MALNVSAISASLHHASLVQPCDGERVSGDVAVLREVGGVLFVAMVDVLGHGAEAGSLAEIIEAYLARQAHGEPVRDLLALHEHIRGSRGAAVGLCAIDGDGHLSYAGVGNTVLRVLGARDNRLISRDGIVGLNMRTPHRQELRLEAGDLVLLYTDGVRDRFRPEDYPGLRRDPPEIVTRTVLKRFGKNYDDAACIAVRYSPESEHRD